MDGNTFVEVCGLLDQLIFSFYEWLSVGPAHAEATAVRRLKRKLRRVEG
jgi:hypothetical protein